MKDFKSISYFIWRQDLWIWGFTSTSIEKKLSIRQGWWKNEFAALKIRETEDFNKKKALINIVFDFLIKVIPIKKFIAIHHWAKNWSA